VISNKNKRFVERHFFQIGIKNPPEKDSESEWRDYKFKESAKHKSEGFP
jgi:hypothetical protein